MIRSVTVSNYVGDKVKIVLTQDQPSHGLLVQSIDGLGPAKADINIVNYALMDGAYYNSARLNTRNIVLSLLFGGPVSIEEARHNTYKYFPVKKVVNLLIETDRRTVTTSGYVESNEPDIFNQQEGCKISIICPDPYFYSNAGLKEHSFYGADSIFEFPFSYNKDEEYIEFGILETEAVHNIVYEGDSQIGVTITVHILGSVGGVLAIVNGTTEETFRLNLDKIELISGESLDNGDDIIITTMKGNKSVRLFKNGIYYNVLGSVIMESDWIQLSKGDNLVSYSLTEGFENVQIIFSNRVMYEGV